MGIIKKTFIWAICCLFTFYIALYLILPSFLNKKDCSTFITKAVKDQTGLILVIHGYKIKTAPNLDITLQAQNIQLFYPNNKQIFDIKNVNTNISTLLLLKKEIKINKLNADELQFSTKLLKTGKTTFQTYLEKNLRQNSTTFKFSKELPQISIRKYIVKIKDEESGQKFKFTGNKFLVNQSLDYKFVNIETQGIFYCFDRKYINYKLKISTPKILLKELNSQIFDITADELYKYKLNAELSADIKIHEENEKFKYISGQMNIDNFIITLDSQKLPPSFFHITLDKGKASIISKFYTNKDECTDIQANIKITKPYNIELHCICPKADIENLQKLAISTSKLLKIKNNLSEFKSKGSLSANFNIKTNLKTLKSDGSLKINNSEIKHKNIPLNINHINAWIDFSNDTIKIKKSDIQINNQPVNLKGTIDSKAVGNVILSANNLDLNHILNAFPTLKLNKNLVIKNGKLSLDIKINGKLSEIKPHIYLTTRDFIAYDTKNKINLGIKNVIINAKSNKDKYSGSIALKNILLSSKLIPNNTKTISSEEIIGIFDNKNLIIKPTKINMGNAKLTLNAEVKEYITKPNFIINTGGTIDTALLKSFTPQNTKIYSKGYLPIKALIKSEDNNVRVNINLLSNPTNYFTPIRIYSFSDSNILTDIDVKITNTDIILNDISVYYAGKLNNLIKDINYNKLKKAITIKGKIHDYSSDIQCENIKLYIPEKLKIAIPQTKTGNAEIITDIIINGRPDKPTVNGKIHLISIDIPEYYTKIQNVIFNINKSTVNTKIDKIKINNADFSLESTFPVDILSSNKIDYIKISSEFCDMDYITSLLPLMTQSKYAPGTEFPFTILSGKLYIKNFKMGKIQASNVTADLTSQKNILHIKNMFSDTYGGKTAGKITYNFPYDSIHADIQGRNLDAAYAAKNFLPKEQIISGKLNFDASVDMIGTTFEQQMKTLKGKSNILISNARLGQLGRFEHFLYAQNLLSQKLIYASLNSAKQAISPKDTGYMTYLKGIIKFSNGIAYLTPVWAAGPQMSMYVTGNVNLLNNYTDIEILGKISSDVSSSMGILGTLTIKDFLDKHTKYGTVAENLFNFYNTELPELDISKIPDLNPNYKYQTKNFRVLISGNPESVSSVKSFTWVNPLGTKKMSLEQKNQNREITKTIQTQNVTQNNEVPRSYIKSTTIKQETQPNFLDSIPDDFQ